MSDEFKKWIGKLPSALAHPFQSLNIIFFICFPLIFSFDSASSRSGPFFSFAVLFFEPWIMLFSLGAGIRGDGNSSNFLHACLDVREYWELFLKLCVAFFLSYIFYLTTIQINGIILKFPAVNGLAMFISCIYFASLLLMLGVENSWKCFKISSFKKFVHPIWIPIAIQSLILFGMVNYGSDFLDQYGVTQIYRFAEKKILYFAILHILTMYTINVWFYLLGSIYSACNEEQGNTG